jgi:hypothetical protein
MPSVLQTTIGPLFVLGGWGLTVLSLLPVLVNQFATDGAGLSMTRLAPVTTRDVVRGKILGCGMLGGISMLFCLVAAAVSSPSGDFRYWIAMLLATLSSFLVVATASSVLSILLPRTADLAKLGKAGNPHPLSGALGVLLALVAVAVPGAGFLLGAWMTESPNVTLALGSASLGLALAVAAALERLAVSLADRRRENLLMVASGR